MRLESATEQIDSTTADGEFSRGLKLLIGQRECKIVGARTRRVLHATKRVMPEQASDAILAHKARSGTSQALRGAW